MAVEVINWAPRRNDLTVKWLYRLVDNHQPGDRNPLRDFLGHLHTHTLHRHSSFRSQSVPANRSAAFLFGLLARLVRWGITLQSPDYHVLGLKTVMTHWLPRPRAARPTLQSTPLKIASSRIRFVFAATDFLHDHSGFGAWNSNRRV